ncbi:guanylate kinase [Salsuginibacillus halophilus]|uniref:Guanylate kinase n=1 Tax=Salsuginibacillus halophilus TaxID=517424 RepID=A0A2P8HY25_9BACI|nr:guanylate kinase [Salsuginibacillus halophilus]PSL51136.1 guanylate kinase [Salsuginibacillus halophilus]
MKQDKGLLLVLSGPAGVGKGTVCSTLRESDANITYSVSATTRAPREGEVDGVNYYFKTRQAFEDMIAKGELLEWAQYVNNYYGTPLPYVEKSLESGNDIMLEIEVQGAEKVKERYPDGVFIFLMPPSLEELKNRIVNRGTESMDTIHERMTVAKDELDTMDMYDYVVVNDEVESAVERIRAILTAEHCRKDRLIEKYKEQLEAEN